MKIFFYSNFIFISTNNLFSAETSLKSMPKHEWSFKGMTGTFDRSAVQRGYKVFLEKYVQDVIQ